MDHPLRFFGVFGFLERLCSKSDYHTLTDLPSPLPAPDNVSPNYGDLISRCFETGDSGCFETVTDYLRLDHYANQVPAKEPNFIESVGTLQSELHRRIKDKFSLDTPDTSTPSSDSTEALVDVHLQFLECVPASVFDALRVSAASSSYGLKHCHLDFETQQLVKKRLRNRIDVKKYSVTEDTSQRLPTLTKLIKNPAYNWSFELDTFQKQAILCLERNQSVFVAAHTSAGKTVVAEYASAMCRRRGSRVIYTSPIKALSNQKFHDFRRTFGSDVGLLTGDIKVATDSSLLVMTTEILYNMLCSSAEAIRDLEVVIMDEVHYLNDVARGHVWEQIMIMLPKHVLLVMLSATVPNTLEFADWLGRVRGSEIHVVTTDKRPVPLEHYLFTGLDGQACDKELHLVVDQHSRFNLPGYKRALLAFNAPKKRTNSGTSTSDTSRVEELKALGRLPAGQQSGRSRSGGGGGSKHSQQMTGGKVSTPGRRNYTPSSSALSTHEKRVKNMWLGVVRLLEERNLMPAIAFGFSRNSLEALAESLTSVDLLSKDEKNEVQHFLRLSIKNRLKGPDALLPSVLFVSNLACRGLAVHHAGMLPLLKETVEILFQRGLIRLLFATETFAMGVNMPARCVLFTTLEKYDGIRRRPLNPGEYTQMAGRAGRRGLDASGTVIIMVEGVGHSVASLKSGLPSQETLTNMILGIPTHLSSQFKITYTMILHLHRTNWLSPQDIMRRSFMEAPALKREIARRQNLSRLRSILDATTTLIPSVGATSSTALSWTSKAALMAPSTVPVGEPVLQVKCPLGELSCCESMAIYYQACCRLRHLAASVSSVLAAQPLSDLQRVLCPGRLVFIQLPAAVRPTGMQKLLPNWLVPAIIVDVNKASIQGVTEVQCNLITWLPSDRSKEDSSAHLRFITTSSANTTTSSSGPSRPCTVEDADMDDDAEEDILLEGEDCWMSTTPFPPQLMPLFIPSSFSDALSRLTLMPNQNFRNFVRVCDQVVQFKSFRASINANITLSDQLMKAIRRHRQEMAAAEAGLRLVVGTNTSSADSDLPQFMIEVNQGLLDLIQPLVGMGSADAIAPPSMVYGLLPDCPPPLHLGRATRAKANTEDASTLFDELWMLNEELTAPLTGGPLITAQHIAPVTCPDLVAHLALFHRTCRRRWAVKRLETILSDDKLRLNAEYLGRLRVLEELGFIDSASERGCLTLKGLVACELQQMEVLLTQLLLDGSFTKLPPADIAALLSCFVFDIRASDHVRDDQMSSSSATCEKPGHLIVLDSSAPPVNTNVQTAPIVNLNVTPQELTDLPDHLLEPVLKIYESSAKLQQLQRKHCLSDPTTDTHLNCSLVRVTHAWATGHPFATLVQMTGTQEGNLVRGLLRLDELLRHVCNACHRLGDQALGLRMNEARMAVHRDLVCAPSLYLSDDIESAPEPAQ